MSTNSAAAPAPRRGRPLLYVLGGCGALIGLVFLACAANAIYWTVFRRDVTGQGEAPVDQNLAEFAALPAGVAADGEQTFDSASCSACHSLAPGVTIVGPSMAGVGASALARRPGYTAEEYLLESIVNPSAYVVPSFQRGVMPPTFQSQLSDQELADLVAFLLTQ